ncbi:MAG: ribosome assembly RNA-binding protein YhbY [Ruminococcaceae bacterium]|nr:ribosome assembly RNA-binding protein YhbY [Oscillospiraceae bacterium]
MLTSKQRATLRSMANGMDTIFQLGKGGVCDNFIKQVDDALTARELIKLRILEASMYSAREAAEEIAPLVGAEVVQVIGTKFVLYRQNKEKPKIEI